MTQAQASLARIESGEYVPDPAACGMTFEDGSKLKRLAKDPAVYVAFDKYDRVLDHAVASA